MQHVAQVRALVAIADDDGNLHFVAPALSHRDTRDLSATVGTAARRSSPLRRSPDMRWSMDTAMA